MSGRAPTSGGVRRYSFYTPGEQPTATAAPTDAEPAAASTSSSHANAPPTPTLPTAEDEPGPVRPIAEDPSAAANGGEAAAGSADANADADTNASATGTANHDGSTGGGAAVQAQQRAQGPSSPAKVVYSFYSSGDLDAMLQVAQQPLGGGGEKENSQEQSSSSSSRGHRPLKPRPAGPANVNDEDEGIVVDDVVGEDGVGPEVVEGGTQEADEPAGDAAATSTSAAAPPAEPLGLESIAHSDDDDDDDDDEEIYQHEEYQEEEGENTESILRKLSLEEERGSLRTKEESNGRQLPAQAQTHVHKASASAEILRGLQQTPRHRNVGVGIDVGANDANAMCKANADDCGKQSQQRLPPPVMVTNGGSNADLTASPAITTAAAAIDAFGVLAEGNDYGAARSLSEIPEAQVEVMTADGGGDGASSSSAEDIVWDALRLVRQRAAERRQLRQHCEETALHQPQHHPQQVMAMTTPTRPQAQVETGRAATDGGERQLEPPLERVGGPAGEGEGGPPPLPPASGLTTVSVPVQQASPGQSSLLTPMADVRKLVSTSSSDMFRPPVEATPGRKAQRATEADARPSLHLAGPVMSTSAMTPGRGPTANAQRAQIPSEGGPDLVSEDEALERGLEMVLTAILEQSRLGRSGYDGGVVGPTNTLDAVVSSLFRGDTGHLTDDRFSRPSRRTSAEIGGGPEHHIQKRSVAEGLLASASPVYDEVALARDSMASPSSMLVESASSPRMTDLSHLDASATATGADVSRASSTSTGGGGGKHRVLGRLSKGMGGRTGIVLSNDAEVDTEEDEDQSFGATVDSQSHAINPLDDGDGSDEESQDIYEDEEHSPKGQDESPPPSPSLLRSFSDKAGLTKSGSSSYDEDDDDEMLQRGASFRGENEEAHALMRILCAHLLPVGLAKSAKKSETPDGAPDKNFGSWLSKGSANLDESDDDQNDEDDSLANPSWDDEDLDEPGYVVHRLSMAQLQRVEKEFQIMINRVRQTSERRLLEGGGTKASSGSASNLSQNKDRAVAAQDDDFERDLEEAEELLDREEQRIQAEQKAAAAASGKQKSASPIPLPRSSTDDNSAADSESSNSSSDKDSDDEDSSDDEESDSTSESGSDVDDSVDMAEWSSPNKEGDDLAMLAGGSAAIPSHLAGNPNFPHVFPSGQGRRGDMELFHLPIIYKAHQTGFEPTKDIVLEPGSIFAGQYLVQNELGSAAFSTAYRCIDLHSGQVDEDGEEYHEEVCLKVIKNTKDFLDQSLDEIKVLELLRRTEQCDQNCLVEMKAFFYHREHLVIVTELLRQNLYEFGKFIMENDEPPYFTRQRLCYITRQSLMALDFIHKLGLIHSDIKPENILLSSYSRAKVKVIDFGSSCYLTDRQSSYIQSRSYRAPEVVLGLPYDGKIDIWSLGCVVAEMYTGLVTFQNDSVVSMLSRIEAICGAFPRHLIAKGRQSGQFFTASGLLYEKADPDEESHDASMSSHEEDSYNIFQPKTTTLAARLGFDPDLLEKTDLQPEEEECAMFVDFVRQLLTIDPDARPTAEEALRHPWILSSYRLTEDDIRYPPEGEESESESEEDD